MTTTAEKDAIWHGEQHSYETRASSPYRRLKLVMDYWCALWFWPIEHADDMPTREDFIAELGLILDTEVLTVTAADDDGEGQQALFPSTMDAERARTLKERFGVVNLEELTDIFPRFALVQSLADRYRFFHWELEFADIFHDRGGFDLVLGNPPWRKVEWNESGVMGDADPYGSSLKTVKCIENSGKPFTDAITQKRSRISTIYYFSEYMLKQRAHASFLNSVH